jgi:Tol biopolymer transport system component
LYALAVLFSALMVLVGVLGRHGGTYASGETLPPNLAVDRIAYVGPDGQIRTVAPDGSTDEPISPNDGFFSWPTWSPNGRRLVFSGVVLDSDGEPQTVLYARNTVTGGLRQLHSGERGVRAFVAERTPHYPYWSPDGNRLAFVGNSRQGLELYLDDLRDNADPTLTLGDGPLWMGWSPDSLRLLVHRGLDLLMVDVEDGRVTPLSAASDPFGYRVPSWRPSGDAITFVAGDASAGYTLYLSDPDGFELTPVGEVPGNTAFLWSPDGQWLAVARPERVIPFAPLELLVYQRISVLAPDGSVQEAEIEGKNVVAFFWSPDSTKLAYVALTDAPGVLRWSILNFTDGEDHPLVDFRPSVDQLTVIRYFDQFAGSHFQWSPDSQSIVFAGRLASLSVSASRGRGQGDKIIVVAIPPALTVDTIAEGSLGFWSPR